MKLPTNCPSCDSKLVRENATLYCRNEWCEGQQFSKLVNYCKKRKIKGLSDKSLEKLKISSIIELYSLAKEELVSVLGKNGEKIDKEIRDSLNTELGELIGSLGIRLVGMNTAEKLTGTLDNIGYSNLGKEATKHFEAFLESSLYDELLEIPFNVAKEVIKETKGTICITGKFSTPRAVMAKDLTARGYKVVNTVTKSLNFLLTNDINSTSSKVAKARNYNIKIITLENT